MAQAIVFVAVKIVSFAKAAYAIYKASALIRMGVQLAVIMASRGLSKKSSSAVVDQGSELKLKFDPSMTRQVPIGYCATGGSIAFTHTWTDDTKVPNKYLERVVVLSDYPIQGVVGVYGDGKALSFTGDINTGRFACQQYLSKSGAPRMWIRVYTGSMTPTVDPYLKSVAPSLWTDNHKGVGIAYAVITKEYDSDAFGNGEPELFFAMQGAKLYDDRYDGSKPGRVGPQRLNDQSTHVYTENAAVAMAHFMRGFKINGKLIVGVGADDTDLADSMLLSAYNICDQQVASLVANVNEPRYRIGLLVNSKEDARTSIEHFVSAMDGDLFDRG
ncbi:MAG: hypothetical protein ACRDBG_15775, partial [Waterburya sp.]